MSRADRRAKAKADRAAKWRHLARDLRGMAGNDQVLGVSDRVALRDAAKRLDAGERPALVMARIAPTLARIDALTKR